MCRSLEVSGSTDALCQRHIHYFDESFCLAIEHRLVHEHDGKPPPQFPVKSKALVPDTSRTTESTMSTNRSVDVETKAASKATMQQLQQSTVADARSKFEQVLQASRQAEQVLPANRQAAAAAGGDSVSLHTHSDKKPLTTDDAVPAPRRQSPNKLMSALLYSQLVDVLFVVN